MNKEGVAVKKASFQKERDHGQGRNAFGTRQMAQAQGDDINERFLVPYDPLSIYLFEIKRYKLLTREQEIELATRIRDKKDEKAAYRLITSNLRLVVKIAMNFRRYWAKDLIDLIQEGNLGLLQAVRKYDPDRGTKFSYYASFWIKAYMLKFIMENWKLVKIGTTQSQRKLFFNLAKEKEKLMVLGINPEPGVLAQRLDVKEEEVMEMSQRLGEPETSINATLNDESTEPYGSMLPDLSLGADERLSANQSWQTFEKELRKFRNTLYGREADIFDHRILAEDPATLVEIANKYHISRERVRQLQVRILINIKKWLRKEVPNFEEEYPALL